jgi:hypothetical protein
MIRKFVTFGLIAAYQLLATSPSKAVMTYNIAEVGGNLIISATGSLILPPPSGLGSCGTFNGGPGPGGAFGILGGTSFICTGPETGSDAIYYTVSPSSSSSYFSGTANLSGATSSSGLYTAFAPGFGQFLLSPAYVSGDVISSSSTFNGVTLASLGITATGLFGTWAIGSDTIEVFFSPEPATSVPGPLPLLGAAAAFVHSRKFRARVRSASSSQA